MSALHEFPVWDRYDYADFNDFFDNVVWTTEWKKSTGGAANSTRRRPPDARPTDFFRERLVTTSVDFLAGVARTRDAIKHARAAIDDAIGGAAVNQLRASRGRIRPGLSRRLQQRRRMTRR
jgi:hypothetical protein